MSGKDRGVFRSTIRFALGLDWAWQKDPQLNTATHNTDPTRDRAFMASTLVEAEFERKSKSSAKRAGAKPWKVHSERNLQFNLQLFVCSVVKPP